MTLPQILVDLMNLLFDMAVPVAICTMVLAGIALRQEGGVNFQADGRFQRWALWSVILLTLPQFLSWFAAQGITMPPQGGNISSPWVTGVETAFKGFVTNIVVAKLTPVLAAFCVMKARSMRPRDKPPGFHHRRYFSALGVGNCAADAELEQRLGVRNHRHADICLEFSCRHDSARSRRVGGRGSDLQLRPPPAIHAAGGIGAGFPKCFGHLETGAGHGRLMKTRR
jgi:hypothetical protein